MRKENDPEPKVDSRIPCVEITPDPARKVEETRAAALELGAHDVVKAIDEFKGEMEKVDEYWDKEIVERLRADEEFRMNLKQVSYNLTDRTIDRVMDIVKEEVSNINAACRGRTQEVGFMLLWKWIERAKPLVEAADYAKKEAYPYYKEIIASYRRWRGLSRWCDFNKVLEEKYFTEDRK